MSEEIFSIATPFPDVASLAQGYLNRADGERLLLPLSGACPQGSGLRFVVYLADGTPAFAGAGLCSQVSDQGETVPLEQRYETLLEALQFDERSRPVYEYIVAVRNAAYAQQQGEQAEPADPDAVDADAVDADAGYAEAVVEDASPVESAEAYADADAYEAADAAEEDAASLMQAEQLVRPAVSGDDPESAWAEAEGTLAEAGAEVAEIEPQAAYESAQPVAFDPEPDPELQAEPAFESAFEPASEFEADAALEVLDAAQIADDASLAPDQAAAASSFIPPPLPTGLLTRPARTTHWQPSAPRRATPRPSTGLFQYASSGLPRPANPPFPSLDRAAFIEPAPRPQR